MKSNTLFLSLIVTVVITGSFVPDTRRASAYEQLREAELRALRANVIREYEYDLTGRKGCNKTRIKYLGIARTGKGKQ